MAVPHGAGEYFRAVPKVTVSGLLVFTLELAAQISLYLLRAKEHLVQNLPVARSRCFGQAQGAPALFCLSSCRGCGSFPGWRFYLGHDVHQPPPGAILGDFISSLFKLIFLFSATHCGGENHIVTLSCVEGEKSFVVLNLMISLGAASPCRQRATIHSSLAWCYLPVGTQAVMFLKNRFPFEAPFPSHSCAHIWPRFWSSLPSECPAEISLTTDI